VVSALLAGLAPLENGKAQAVHALPYRRKLRLADTRAGLVSDTNDVLALAVSVYSLGSITVRFRECRVIIE
jgi:hypothetical protein